MSIERTRTGSNSLTTIAVKFTKFTTHEPIASSAGCRFVCYAYPIDLMAGL